MQLYKLSFPNGKNYIGITSKTALERFALQCLPNPLKSPLTNAIKRVKPENIELTVLGSFDNWGDLIDAEYLAIEEFRAFGGKGYNQSKGGDAVLSFGFDGQEVIVGTVIGNDERKIEVKKAYRQTPKSKASQKAYKQTPEYKAYQKEYSQTPEAKAVNKAYSKTPKGMEVQKAYSQTPKAKAAAKERSQTPEAKAARKAYRQTTKGKEVRKAYWQTPEAKAVAKAARHDKKLLTQTQQTPAEIQSFYRDINRAEMDARREARLKEYNELEL